MTYTCACGHSYTEAIPVKAHTWLDATLEAPATCSVCLATKGQPLVPDVQHSVTENLTPDIAEGSDISEDEAKDVLKEVVDSFADVDQPKDNGLNSEGNADVIEGKKDEILNIEDGKDYSYGTTLKIQVKKVVVDKQNDKANAKKVIYDVTPYLYARDDDGNTVGEVKLNAFNEEITFRLAIYSDNGTGYARVWHDGTEIELHKIMKDEATGSLYIEVKTKSFSEFAVELHEHEYEVTEHQDATCTDEGHTTYTCSIEPCEATYTEEIEIDAEAHDLKQVEAKAPSYTEVGWDAYEYCQREGCEYSTYNEIPMLIGFKVTMDDRTNGKAVVSLVDGSIYAPGATFTVSCTNACVVAISTNAGDTYTELECTAVAGMDNTYQFTIPETISSNFQIGIVLRGDARGDGEVKTNDAVRIQRYLTPGLTSNNTLDSLTILAADARCDGGVKTNDAVRIQRYLTPGLTSNNTLEWNIAE